MYKLYYYPRNASWVPHVVLEELGLPFELQLVDRSSLEQKSDEYLKLNPTGRIPTLIAGENVIFESAAISLYLCEQCDGTTLIPPIGHADRAAFYQWMFYLTGTVQAELMLFYYPNKHSLNDSCARGIKEAQELRITKMFSLLDEQLQTRSTLVGDKVTLCDFYLLMLAFWAEKFDQPPLSFEHLGQALRTLAKRRSVEKVCLVEGVSLLDYQ